MPNLTGRLVATVDHFEREAEVDDEAICGACDRISAEAGPLVLCLVEYPDNSRPAKQQWLCAEDVVWLNPEDGCMTATPIRFDMGGQQ